MRIEQLEYLAAVTQHGSLRRASESLHVSQPALSEALSKLERELGLTLLDRHRSGARISPDGRDLIGHMVEILDAVDRLRTAAGDRRQTVRQVRVGTVGTATSSLLVPAIAAARADHPDTLVELVTSQQSDIDRGLLDGSLDLGLVNVLGGDDPPAELVSTDLVHGRPVVVLPAGHRLVAQSDVTIEQLRAEPLVSMRAGYVMHRFAHRIFGADLPRVVHGSDGAEMGKTLVAQGLGVTVLPDFSVDGDPLERAGLIVTRPLRDDHTIVTLVLRHRAAAQPGRHVRALVRALVEQSRTYAPRRAAAAL